MPATRFPRSFVLLLGSFVLLCCAGGFASQGNQRLVATPTSLSFGSVQVGTSQSLSEVLTNSSSSSVIVSQATVSGAAFSLRGLSLPLTLGPGQSYTFSAVFAPNAAGVANGSLTMGFSSPTSSLGIALSGTGTAAGQLAGSPANLNFGSIVVGSSGTLNATLSSIGASATITSVTTTSPEFALGGLSFPLTLAPGQSVSFSVKFTPQGTGTASGSFSFAGNAMNSPLIESLSGVGTTAPAHKVSLSWASSTSGVIGYNVYRGTATSGPYTKINPVLDASNSYIDSSVQAGQAYYYMTTSVTATGKESTYSNQVRAVIPTP